MILDQIITVIASGVVSFVLAIASFRYDLLKIKANTSSEISKSDQDKITTAEKTIELVDKLRLSMERQYEQMQKEIQDLKTELELYVKQCASCANNKMKR